MNDSKGIVYMVCTGGLFIIGKLNGSRLSNPRVFQIIENGAKIQMSPLPGEPGFIILRDYGFSYEVALNTSNSSNILDLYYRVTHPQPQAPQQVQAPPTSELPMVELN